MPGRCVAALLLALLLALPRESTASQWKSRIRTVGDHLLDQQSRDGCIADTPRGVRANEDSHMQYALLALAHAYRITRSDRFRRGLREGIAWLAERMETREKGWVGSWRYAYSARRPYVALPTPPAEGIDDARGLSSTSALFVYLLALYTEVAQDGTPARTYKAHARAALDFILDHNLAKNRLFYNGWHRPKGHNEWAQFRMHYAADQADCYLGLRAGYYILGQRRYNIAATRLRDAVPKLFYSKDKRVLGTALDSRGRLVLPKDNWEGYFAQGYLAWSLGPMDETRAALKWLNDRHAPDGSIRTHKSKVPYTLPAALFCLGSYRLNSYHTQRDKTKRWLRDSIFTTTGGIRDFAHRRAPVYSNLAGWVVAAWASAHPFPTVRPPDPNQPVWPWYWYRRQPTSRR